MAVRTIERTFPGRSATELYGEAEKILRKLGERYGITCQFDAAGRRIVVPEKMGLKGLCTVSEEHIRVELTHGLLGGALVGTIQGYVEEKLGKLFE
jgi:putative polyhydroxyalkanoate system protein